MPKPVHASAVYLPNAQRCGLLITGDSGSGKSSLALQLLTRGGLLIADDQVLVHQSDASESITASAPPTLSGLLEVVGVGIVRVPSTPLPCLLHGVVQLNINTGAHFERIPLPTIHKQYGLPMLHVEAHHPLLAEQVWAWAYYPLVSPL